MKESLDYLDQLDGILNERLTIRDEDSEDSEVPIDAPRLCYGIAVGVRTLISRSLPRISFHRWRKYTFNTANSL